MHYYYDDKNWIEDNELVICVYLHSDLCSGHGTDDREWDLNSIQSAKHIHPYQLKTFLESFNYIFPNVAKTNSFEEERFYKFYLRFTDYYAHDFEITNVKDVSESNNEYDRLH